MQPYCQTFHESFLTTPILLTGLSAKDLLLSKMLLDKKFSSANAEFFVSVAAIYHALLIAVENRVLPITGIKL